MTTNPSPDSIPGPAALRWTHLTVDLTPAWSDLITDIVAVDGTDEVYSAEDLAEELTAAGFNPVTDSLAVFDEQRLVAYSQLTASSEPLADGNARVVISGGVHPDYRGRGLASQLFDRMEPRARELAADLLPGNDVQLRVSGGLDSDPVRPLLTDRGYAAARYSTVMKRAIPDPPVAAGPVPTGLRVVAYRPELSEALRRTHNDAFAGHWGSTAVSPERWNDVVTSRTFRPALARLVVDADDQVLAYVLPGQWVDRELYINLVGTHTAARGQGLARAALTSVIQAATDSGDYDIVELDVDSENPTGAGDLYTSVGFEKIRVTATFTKVVPALPGAQ